MPINCTPPIKVTPHIIRRIAWWILGVILLDLIYNALPALKDAQGNPQPFFSINLLWVATSVIGVGGICIWAYLRSFATTRLIPVQVVPVQRQKAQHMAAATGHPDAAPSYDGVSNPLPHLLIGM